ncbi:glycoside hydrolase family 3 C-terminal domain-containing protein [Streptomyces sp. NPDC058424]|uniref:glycoside hydrolase family 3 C-terminal domain-containing protein n=1 Tax=Streptomyces sp. NPDC058424 TaxID=3346491 RepID=UPI00365FAC01
MSSFIRRLLASTSSILLALGVFVANSGASEASTQPWLAPGLTTEQRVDMLLANMTLDEKIAELHAGKCAPYEACIRANPSLGLPELVLQDDSTGVGGGMKGVTALPASIAASASWDPALIKSYGAVIGREMYAKGINVALAPTVNITRNPQWGRNFESLGEDPYLTSRMGVADMAGLQSQGIVADMKHFAANSQETNRQTISAQIDPRTLHEIYLPAFAAAVDAGLGSVMASYNAINGVFNSQNPYLLTTVLRDEMGFDGFVRSDGEGTYSTVAAANAGLDMQVKGTDYFAAPLKAAVEDGQVSMATINSMLRPILTTMFNFDLVGKQWGNGTTEQNVITPGSTQTALDAAEQGTVLLKNQGDLLPLSASSLKSVAVIGQGVPVGSGSGNVNLPFLVSPVQGIQAAANQATVSYADGLPDPATLPSIPAQYLSTPYKAGNGYTATLTPPVSGRYTLVVHNTMAHNPMTLSVNGTPILIAAGSAGNKYGIGSVDLQAGQHYQISISGPSVSLAWATPSARSAAISQAVAAASQSEVAVVLVGDQESENIDRVGIGLSGGQNQLVDAVATANPRTIVVLNTGSPVLMPWLDKVAGVVEAWYPGEHDGTALADVLFGKVNPSGKLPMTFPASEDQVPASTPEQFPGVNGVADYSEGLEVGYRWYDAHDQKPLFPFGYGLSYTKFAFSHLSVSPTSTTSLGTVQVGATVTNTGTRTGAEVAQLYLGFPSAAGEPPRQLKGFQKVTLAPGKSTRVHFTLTPQDLSIWDAAASTWSVPTGAFQVQVGDSSADLPLSGPFQVAASTGARTITLDAPSTIQTGSPVTVHATLAPGGNLDLHDVALALNAPAGWQITPVGSTSADTLHPDQPLTGSWQVTAPAGAQADVRQLTATAKFSAPGHGSSGTKIARTQVTVQPLVTTTLTPQSVLLDAGQSGTITLRNTNTSGYPVTLTWQATPPDGVTAQPASGTATLAPGASSTAQLNVTASKPGAYTVPVQVTATAGSTTLTAPGAYLKISAAYSTLAAASNNVGITDDSDHTPGNFDGSGNSYSAQALADKAITPGSTITDRGVAFTWPDVPAGTADNVAMQGQLISLSGSGSTLGFLGAGVSRTQSGSGIVYYTDGSSQPFTIGFADWFSDVPSSGGDLVATTEYLNRTNGKPPHTVSLFAAFVPLQQGKTMRAVQLPDAGAYAMHAFDIAIN